jgi:hypothetical protein
MKAKYSPEDGSPQLEFQKSSTPELVKTPRRRRLWGAVGLSGFYQFFMRSLFKLRGEYEEGMRGVLLGR